MKWQSLKILWVIAITLLGSTFISMAQLRDLRNELYNDAAGRSVNSTDKKLVILIHGWMNSASVPENYSAYLDSKGRPELFRLFQWLKLKLNGTDWGLSAYRWENDAATGFIQPSEDQFIYGAAVEAARNAANHGTHLGKLINEETLVNGSLYGNIREVQFIAHSAGSWAAREAMRILLQNNPYCVCQLTLLDPFIPNSGNLSETTMSGTKDLAAEERIHRMENYYADDFPVWDVTRAWTPTPWTQSVFSWRNGIDINKQVAHGLVLGLPYLLYYHFHSGPLEFYADSVISSIQGQLVPSGLVQWNPPSDRTNIGYFKSRVHQNTLVPRITEHPKYDRKPVGDNFTFAVAGNRATWFQWFKNGEILNGETSSRLELSPLTSADAGEYVVRVSNDNGVVFSDAARLEVTAVAQPQLESITPSSFVVPAAGVKQPLTFTGTNFTANSRLTFSSPSGSVFASRAPYNQSGTSLSYDVDVGSSTGEWTVTVTDGALSSNSRSFYVLPTSTSSLTALSIEGPSTLGEGQTANYAARAYYSNGTNSVVTGAAVWSENSSATTISGGVLTASTVSSDAAVTVTASYTAGGITRTATALVTVLNNAGGGGAQTVQLVTNGNFSNGSTGWDRAFNFYADNRFASANSPGGYAYVSLEDGSAGNNLYGELCQYVTIPATATEVTFTYWTRITTAESGGAANDNLFVQILRPGGTAVTIDSRSNLHASTGYQQRTFSLLPYKGERVYLCFTVQTNGSNPTTFRIDDVSINAVVPPAVTLSSASINGPSSLGEGTSADYTLTAIYSDGSTRSVNADNWSEDSSVTTISNSGRLTAGSVSSDRTVTITASYTDGVTRPASKTVTVINAGAELSFLAISGPSQVDEGVAAQYTAQAIFSDGTSRAVQPSWTMNGGGVISSGGLMTPPDVASDSQVTVLASYTLDGVTRNASQTVSVRNVAVPLTLSTLAISGAASVPEGTTAQYTAVATYSNGSTREVGATWSESAEAISVSAFGLLSAGQVAVDTPVTLNASYTEGGVTRTASLAVTVTNVPDVPFISVSPASITQSIVIGDNAPSQTFTVSNSDTGTLNYSIDTGGATWFSVTPASGRSVGEADAITVNFNTTALPAGTHVGIISVVDAASGNSPMSLSVTVNVRAAQFQITELKVPPTGPVSVKFRGTAGATYKLQRSPNLQEWFEVANSTAISSGIITMEDPSARMPGNGFYRVVSSEPTFPLFANTTASFNYGDSAELSYPEIRSTVPIPGLFEDDFGGVLFRSNRPRGGGTVFTKSSFNLAGKEVEFIWSGTGGGSFNQVVGGSIIGEYLTDENVVDNYFVIAEFGNLWANSLLAEPGVVYRTLIKYTESTATMTTFELATGTELNSQSRTGDFSQPQRLYLRHGDNYLHQQSFIILRSLIVR
jgi:hypothetical protein